MVDAMIAYGIQYELFAEILKIQISDFLEYNFKKTYQVEECRKGTKKSFQKCYKHKSKIHPQFLPEQDTQFPRKIRKKWGWPNKLRNLPKWSKRTIAKWKME